MCTDNLMQLNKLAHISICNNNQRWCVRVRNQVYRINCPPCKSNCACVRGEAKLINSHCALFIFGVKANVLRGRERANLCCDWELVLRVPSKILLLFSLGGLLRKMSVIEFSFDSERERRDWRRFVLSDAVSGEAYIYCSHLLITSENNRGKEEHIPRRVNNKLRG